MPNYPEECEYWNLDGQFLVHKASQVNLITHKLVMQVPYLSEVETRNVLTSYCV